MVLRNVILACLLTLALPAVAGERVSEVVRDLHANGYATPALAVARLQAAEDRPDASAPLKQRHVYAAAIGNYASWGRKPAMVALAQASMQQLESMAAQEQCRDCGVDAQFIQVQLALTAGKIDAASKALAAASQQSTGVGPAQQLRMHLLRASLYRSKGLFAQGITEALPAIDLAKQLHYTVEQIGALNLLLLFNAALGDHERAEAYGSQAYALAKRIGDRSMLAEIQLNRGYNFAGNKQSERELQAYQDGLHIAESDPGSAVTQIILLSNLADHWLQHGDYRKALERAQQAEALAKQEEEPLTMAYARTNAGVAKAYLGQVEAGILDVRSAIEVAKNLGSPDDEIGIAQELAGILERAGRYREALAEVRKIEAMQQAVTRQKRDKAVLELQEKYSAEARQREIERLADANRIKEAELSAQTWQQRLWVALAVVLALAAILLVQGMRRMRHANRRLSDDVEELEEKSSRDPLTGVFNRRRGHALLQRHASAIQRAAEGAAPTLLVVLLDIDFFKRVNDTYGHAAGDRVLVEVARRLLALLRDQDAVVRWGGEEFLLLSSASDEVLQALVVRVLQAIAGSPISVGDQLIPVTLSAGGIASPFGAETSMEALVQLADLALYRAKATGRNRAVCVTPQGDAVTATVLGQDLAAASAAGLVRLESLLGPDIGSGDAAKIQI